VTEQIEALRCVCITAPTACGKTALALALAERWPVEIVSMDSAIVYRGLDIGTAKPSPAERAAVPHHLIDVVEPFESYSAGRFADEARRVVAQVSARGRLPLVVGGTMLYLRALRQGLAALPQRDAGVRRALDAQADRDGWPAMHERLARIDPAAAARIAPQDRQRIQRALEVHALTGQPLTVLHEAQQSAPPPMLTLALVPEDRAELAERIARRFDRMVDAGFLAEVRALMERGDLTPDMPSMRAVGYRQLWGHLAGEYGWDEARRRAIVATRRLAKRQLTWLRHEPGIETLPAFGAALGESVAARVVATGLRPA
jgi:tRNA dimethylallyltransferase